LVFVGADLALGHPDPGLAQIVVVPGQVVLHEAEHVDADRSALLALDDEVVAAAYRLAGAVRHLR